jgi:hypothetical protein
MKKRAEKSRVKLYKAIDEMLNSIDVKAMGIDEEHCIEQMKKEMEHLKHCFVFCKDWKHEHSIYKK